MTKFKTILFDLDGTLLDFNKTEIEALTHTFEEIKIEPTEDNFAAYMEANSKLWEQLEQGLIDKDTLKTQRFKDFFESINFYFDEYLASEVYIRHLSNGHFVLDGAKELLRSLDKKHTLAAATNGISQVQHSRIVKSGLKRYFKHLFISDEIGHAKPKVEFFEHIFKAMSIDNLEDVIIIGDSLTSDIKGGNNAGIATCWYNPKGLKNKSDSICDFEIFALAEFKDIVS